MRLSDAQVRRYLEAGESAVRDGDNLREAIEKTVEKSKAAFYENEAQGILSSAEFLYQQSKYIHKYWWVLQAGVLAALWALLKFAGSSFDVRRCMGVGAPVFAVLFLPELWKNRNAGAMEIECAAYYSLRQIYAARIFLFGLVDFFLLCFFSMTMILTGRLFVWELLIHFFLPYLVTCCICFQTFMSRRMVSEALALVSCLVWCVIWNQLVMSERVYEAISPAIWLSMLMISLFYLGYGIYRVQRKENGNSEALLHCYGK